VKIKLRAAVFSMLACSTAASTIFRSRSRFDSTRAVMN
jgi:hypothetical protein